MGNQIEVKPELIRWALGRSRLNADVDRSLILEKANQWINGQNFPTITELTKFAKKVMVPFGYLFLESPPEEPLPMTEFSNIRRFTACSSESEFT